MPNFLNMPTFPEAEYSAFVQSLRKDPLALLAEATPEKLNLDHAIIGICTEAGEIADAVKKHTIYNQPLDTARLRHIIEELGDIEFFLELLRSQLFITRDDCLKANIVKLGERYKSLVYTDTHAKLRLDKAAEQQQADGSTL